jgi:hypothetical protein
MKSRWKRHLFSATILLALAVPYLATELWVRSVRFQELADYYEQKLTQIGTVTRWTVNPTAGRSYLAVVQNGTVLPEGPEADELERRYIFWREKSAEFNFAAKHPWYPIWLPRFPDSPH